MTKAEIVAKISQDAGINKSQAERALNSFVEALTTALKKGERVAIPSLGVFNVRQRNARIGRNPQTGEPVHIPAKKVVKFSPSYALKNEVNQ